MGNLTSQILESVGDMHAASIGNLTQDTFSNLSNSAIKHISEQLPGLPTYVSRKQEFYDSDTPIMGSWHWLSCDHDNGLMYECGGKVIGVLKACGFGSHCLRHGERTVPEEERARQGGAGPF